MSIYVAIDRIKNKDIRAGTKRIMDIYYDKVKEAPASVSGKYHKGETVEDHLLEALFYVDLFITEYAIGDQEADLLKSAALLHDIGNCELLFKGDILHDEEATIYEGESWKYYKATEWSRDGNGFGIHPILSAKIVGQHPFEGSDIVQALVITHMHHWQSTTCLIPSMYKEDLRRLAEIIAMSDYLASRSEIEIKK